MHGSHVFQLHGRLNGERDRFDDDLRDVQSRGRGDGGDDSILGFSVVGVDT